MIFEFVNIWIKIYRCKFFRGWVGCFFKFLENDCVLVQWVVFNGS